MDMTARRRALFSEQMCMDSANYRAVTFHSPHSVAILHTKTVVLKLHHRCYNRGPHRAFYTGVKFVVLVRHPVVLF